MAVTRYGKKRRARRAAGRGRRRGLRRWAAPVAPDAGPPAKTGGTPRFVAVGTVAKLTSTARPALTVWVNGRFEVRVGADFEAATLARLVRTLEQV